MTITQTHGGNLRELAKQAGCDPNSLLDFSANINPIGVPDWLRQTINRELDSLLHYPDISSTKLRDIASQVYQCPAEMIVVGNGSSELLFALMRTITKPRVVLPVPCYIDYATAASRADKHVETILLKEKEDFAVNWSLLAAHLRGDEAVVLGRPNNPTGVSFDATKLRNFAQKHTSTLFIIDEAFIDFLGEEESLVSDFPSNVILLRSLTKFYGIPGLRLGLLFADIATCDAVREELSPWSVNSLAQLVGEKAITDKEYALTTRSYITNARKKLLNQLNHIEGFKVFPGEANYLLIKLCHPLPDAKTLATQLLKKHIAIRVCDNYEGLNERFMRIAVRAADENERLLDAIDSVLSRPVRNQLKRKTPAIMLQGTSSNAGKSVLAAALCRILLQDGLRVAPFKSQNMSLNSFVTDDGGEMGRAQVVQAQACRLKPSVLMNPILLKPNSDTGSQIIVNGKPVGNMRVGEYIRYKAEAFDAAKRNYDTLADEYDAIVLEGAGSPAEVNLKHHDIVNMNMAKYAKSPVLMVGDIDRGGVFASFIGTMEVLNQIERKLIAGFVINRFRGDASLLAPAMNYTEAFTGKPTLGVVPYVPNLGLPEEDSVEFKNSVSVNTSSTNQDAIDIAVIDLPHISNFTDLDALRIEPDVHVRVVRDIKDLRNPNAVILPGSKNTLGDLKWLIQQGFAEKLHTLANGKNTEIVGICGGFQMLGRAIEDPQSIESDAGCMRGLRLLDITTTMATEKTLSRTSTTHLPSGLPVEGYEIHHGQTYANKAKNIFGTNNKDKFGYANENELIWGTYLHGVFDADEFRRWWIDRLRTRRGLNAIGQIQRIYDIEHALDHLAEVVRESLGMSRIYEVMGL